MSARMETLADRIDACLPQTQCTQCGFPRCRLYAEAIACGETDINQCPPGGEVTIHALGELLSVQPKALDPAYGKHKPRRAAVIDESACIGCALCLAACPVDAILGARQYMHTVIAEECTGCELCVPPCPVDCITMVPFVFDGARTDWPWPDYSRQQADRARERTAARLHRLAERGRRKPRRTARKPTLSTPSRAAIRKEIQDAVQRARAKKAQRAAYWKNRAPRS